MTRNAPLIHKLADDHNRELRRSRDSHVGLRTGKRKGVGRARLGRLLILVGQKLAPSNTDSAHRTTTLLR